MAAGEDTCKKLCNNAKAIAFMGTCICGKTTDWEDTAIVFGFDIVKNMLSILAAVTIFICSPALL